MKIFFKLLGAAIVGTILVVLIRTVMFIPTQNNHVNSIIEYDVDSLDAIRHLSDAIKIKTISHDNNIMTDAIKTSFHNFLETRYPLVHQKMEKISMNGSLLFTLSGSNGDLNPVVFMGHYDVVPINGVWDHEPFSGDIANGAIYGRGSLDNKNIVLACLEAMEHLLSIGYQPTRTIMFSFGHDEEIGGSEGTARIVEYLKDQGIKPKAVYDEGGFITNGVIKGVQVPMAVIGIAEKGIASFNLTIEGHGGHSSMPRAETTLGILSSAIVRIQNNPMPYLVSKPAEVFFAGAGPHMSFLSRMAIANRWLLESVLISSLSKGNKTNAVVRTTIAPTIINGGNKSNIVPASVSAVVNARIIPGQTIAEVKQYLIDVINDPRIKVTVGDLAVEASVVSPMGGFGYNALTKSINQIFPDAVVSGYLTISGTDSRYYNQICDNVYRFNPLMMTSDDIDLLHGGNEQIKVESYLRSIQFYIELIKKISGSE